MAIGLAIPADAKASLTLCYFSVCLRKIQSFSSKPNFSPHQSHICPHVCFVWLFAARTWNITVRLTCWSACRLFFKFFPGCYSNGVISVGPSALQGPSLRSLLSCQAEVMLICDTAGLRCLFSQWTSVWPCYCNQTAVTRETAGNASDFHALLFCSSAPHFIFIHSHLQETFKRITPPPPPQRFACMQCVIWTADSLYGCAFTVWTALFCIIFDYIDELLFSCGYCHME